MKETIFLLLMIVILIINLCSCQVYSKLKQSRGKTQLGGAVQEVEDVSKNHLNMTSRKVSKVDIPEWSKDAVLYEVNIRQYTEEGTFKAFEKHLPRLKELGVDILWFMPIHPISKEHKKGTLGSYYSIADYKDVNPEFGTLEEFKELVDKCHKEGFKVLLDWVANHTGWDNIWIENIDWYTQNTKGEIIHPVGTDWTDVASLNYRNEDMREAMLDAMMFWVEEIGIDGYRADYASGVPQDFWEEARGELNKIKPIYMLAEDDKMLNLLEEAFNSNYGWELHHIMNKVATGENNAKHIEANLTKTEKSYPRGTYPMNFTSNHDENSWSGTEYERLGDAVKAMAVLTFTVPGIPLIYSGQETGLNRRLEFFEKDEIIWSDLTMMYFYKDLIALKKENPALWNGEAGGDPIIIKNTDKDVLAFFREKDDNRVIVVINCSPEKIVDTIEMGELTGKYKYLFLEKDLELDSSQRFELEPWEYVVLISNK